MGALEPAPDRACQRSEQEDDMTSAATGPLEYFQGDHRRCDGLWAEVEAAADKGGAAEQHAAFDAAMRRHFELEEQVLFPAIEEATGMTAGPTQVMRMEHTRMRGVLDQMSGAAHSGDWQSVVDHGDTLLMLIGQHNVKEEGILYPMADQFLTPIWSRLHAQIEERDAARAPAS